MENVRDPPTVPLASVVIGPNPVLPARGERHACR